MNEDLFRILHEKHTQKTNRGFNDGCGEGQERTIKKEREEMVRREFNLQFYQRKSMETCFDCMNEVISVNIALGEAE